VGAVAGPIPAGTGRIFISYRRQETAYPAGWLFDRLTERFGGGVFKDVDSIQLGDDFVEVITGAVGSCDVLLALIGPRWLTIADERGRRRLDDPDDFVRLEIEAALARNVRVIPILVDGARMPRAEELPDRLSRLVRRQALELSPARFDHDAGRLLKVLDMTLAEVRAAQQDAASAVAPSAKTPATSTEELPGPPSTPSGSAAKLARARPRRAWVLAGAGVGVALVLLIVVIVVRSGAPSSTGAATTTSPPITEIIVQDDFSTRASGWEAYDRPEFGRYQSGAYRLSHPSADNSAGSVPTNARSVFPSAPPNLRIQVKARRLPTSDQNLHYGISCRLRTSGDGYILTLSSSSARISRYGKVYKVLKDSKVNLDSSATNQLQAVCRNIDGKQAVQLELWVNGQKAVEATDQDNPLPTGHVGLIVETDQTTRPRVAEFDDFAVTRA
jgi:TIR domain